MAKFLASIVFLLAAVVLLCDADDVSTYKVYFQAGVTAGRVKDVLKASHIPFEVKAVSAPSITIQVSKKFKKSFENVAKSELWTISIL
uniref:Venom polypeptide n=1 Tax=Dolopus genitalis TaxID=2488630 RepID=A0A3G5BIC5_DOLGE|nr:venom polypeptide [Dolopus genitalis]